MKWRALLGSGELNGYEAKYPSVEALQIDGMIAVETRCPKCGHYMRYEPRIKGSSYRAFAVCSHCNEVEEF